MVADRCSWHRTRSYPSKDSVAEMNSSIFLEFVILDDLLKYV